MYFSDCSLCGKMNRQPAQVTQQAYPATVPMGTQMPQATSGAMPLYPPSPLIGSALPTGMPMGPITGQFPTATQVGQQGIPAPSQPLQVAPGEIAPAGGETVFDTDYWQGYMRTQIGRRVRVEFLVGTSTITDRTGILVGVGTNYILLREPDSDDIIMADLYAIKFVTFIY